ncbi:beta-mannosidase [Paenibacillus physcomitrellae]|uniref:Beta-mannosidase n=1 Tax=Paenibacillus physcomitrellae TaxID=1619311 RepID=A0ABQ1GFD5_9BACL|nr:glycoside hydrolase family 2 protein [Paenibacillus physcomitrellae]GGA42590.1 beta-mannosidase [Paenibacillus physcomitrellae]
MISYLDLGGSWTLTGRSTQRQYPGQLPGSNYLDLLACGAIQDPFWGMNEKQATQIAEEDYVYARHFNVYSGLLACDKVTLEISGIDTFGVITLNDRQIGNCSNAHRDYRFDVKPYLTEGDNIIEIEFTSPLPYIRRMKKEMPLFHMSFGEIASYVRKPQYHFGWDWGPNLPPVGVSGKIGISGETAARLEEVRVNQLHHNGKVDLQIYAGLERLSEVSRRQPLVYEIELTSPDGSTRQIGGTTTENRIDAVLTVEDPQLWWSNGLGEQPLYELEVRISTAEGHVNEKVSSWKRTIGLRTIRLDTSADAYGNNFRFVVNGVPIFAKGADWIPSDSFVTRTSPEDLEFYIQSARTANMNMLRVWGGGYYESDLFYDLCDRYGILVWQDFGFACNEYPMSDPEFMDSVKAEVEDQVRRLRDHASLALWCGNNEVEPFYLLMKKKSVAVHKRFFFEQLPAWMKQLDPVTPYWPGSPSSGGPKDKAGLLNKGDSHLWQVWHGMKPIEYLGELPARFCSEFGLESMPSMRTIRSFTDAKEPSISDPVMKAHQKSQAGNEKMLFYILSKYRNPANFEDFTYLSQLIQAEAVQMATEGWRRSTGRCNGALYWQYNDCWPTASWSGIDYEKQYKALQYKARHFNAMLCVSAHMRKDKAEIYVINDYAESFTGTLQWKIADFSGQVIASSTATAQAGPAAAVKLLDLDFAEIVGPRSRSDLLLSLTLTDQEGQTRFEQIRLLVPDKKARLQKPQIRQTLTVKGETAELTLQTDTFARSVRVEIEGQDAPLSDNFFDLETGRSITLTFPVKPGTKAEQLKRQISIKTLANVTSKGNAFSDAFRRMAFRLKPINFFTWMIYKFV